MEQCAQNGTGVTLEIERRLTAAGPTSSTSWDATGHWTDTRRWWHARPRARL